MSFDIEKIRLGLSMCYNSKNSYTLQEWLEAKGYVRKIPKDILYAHIGYIPKIITKGNL